MLYINQKIEVITPTGAHPARVSFVDHLIVGIRRDIKIRIDGSKTRGLYKYIANRYGDELLFVYNEQLSCYVNADTPEEYIDVYQILQVDRWPQN